MRITMTLCSALLVITALGQIAKPIQFREESFDFGIVKEEGGPVMHEFVFTNYSNRSIQILTVQASCGCTTPDWTKDLIAPGKTGFVQASFNPKGRPGYFNKSLTVTTNYDSNPIILQIKGQVAAAGESGQRSDFQVENGNWRLKSGSFNMGKVFLKDEPTVRDFQILNGGKNPITYSGEFIGPAYIKADVQPRTIAPGQKGNIKLSYNGKLKDKYGFQSDNIEFITDDEANPKKSFSVYATLEEDFKNLQPEDLAKAPQLKLHTTTLDFGKIQANTSSVREVQFLNTGRRALDIRSIQGNCSCITASAEKTSLKPGESSTIKIAFNPTERKGTQQKSVTVYSNDPRNPVQRVTFTAYIEN